MNECHPFSLSANYVPVTVLGIMNPAANKTMSSPHGGSVLIGEDNTQLNEQDSF